MTKIALSCLHQNGRLPFVMCCALIGFLVILSYGVIVSSIFDSCAEPLAYQAAKKL